MGRRPVGLQWSAMTKNEFHFQTALGQLEEQERHKRVLEVKAVALLGVATTLLGYVLLVSGPSLLHLGTPSCPTVAAGALGGWHLRSYICRGSMDLGCDGLEAFA